MTTMFCKFAEDEPAPLNQWNTRSGEVKRMTIEHYDFGRITVDGTTYTDDVIISPDGVDDSWWREKGHELCCADLDSVWAKDPDILLIGTGARGVLTVLPEARKLMDRRTDQVHVLRTEDAVHRYNELAEKEDRRVVAALHLTC